MSLDLAPIDIRRERLVSIIALVVCLALATLYLFVYVELP